MINNKEETFEEFIDLLANVKEEYKIDINVVPIDAWLRQFLLMEFSMQKYDKNTSLLQKNKNDLLINPSLMIDLKRLIESTKNRVISSANAEL